MRLKAPLPGWTAKADVVVIGSGVAGLTTALQIRAHDLSVLLVTKSFIDAGSTKWAQGGIAAALGPGDSPDQHEKDTLVAGAGLCDLPAVKVLVSEGPEAVRKLIAAGHISMRHGFRGPNFAVVSACASSTHALIEAYHYIKLGKADVMVAGGSEAVVCDAGVAGFNAMKALSERNDDPKTASRPFDKDRDGFVMGEGSGALILEELEHAKKRGAIS